MKPTTVQCVAVVVGWAVMLVIGTVLLIHTWSKLP